MLNYPNMILANNILTQERDMSITAGFYGLCVIVVQLVILNLSKCFHAMDFDDSQSSS